jgi:hypothetical protein
MLFQPGAGQAYPDAMFGTSEAPGTRNGYIRSQRAPMGVSWSFSGNAWMQPVSVDIPGPAATGSDLIVLKMIEISPKKHKERN